MVSTVMVGGAVESSEKNGLWRRSSSIYSWFVFFPIYLLLSGIIVMAKRRYAYFGWSITIVEAFLFQDMVDQRGNLQLSLLRVWFLVYRAISEAARKRSAVSVWFKRLYYLCMLFPSHAMLQLLASNAVFSSAIVPQNLWARSIMLVL